MYITDARKSQASELVELIKIAGEDLPYYLWQIEGKGKRSPIDVGRQLVTSSADKSTISYQNTRVSMDADTLVGAAISYKLPDNPNLLNLHQHPDPVIPLLMLGTKVPGAWHVNAIAVEKQYRNQGVATMLLRDVEIIAAQAGCREVALIANSVNEAALSLYGALGYTSKDQMPVVSYPGSKPNAHWVLLTKPCTELGSVKQPIFG